MDISIVPVPRELMKEAVEALRLDLDVDDIMESKMLDGKNEDTAKIVEYISNALSAAARDVSAWLKTRDIADPTVLLENGTSGRAFMFAVSMLAQNIGLTSSSLDAKDKLGMISEFVHAMLSVYWLGYRDSVLETERKSFDSWLGRAMPNLFKKEECDG